MAKAKRVFEVAKELGVTSKAIVDKCQAEAVPGVTNHMSVVKIGLEQTIHEWFSQDTSTHTAVENAAPVDLKKVRRARRKSAKPVESKDEGESTTATGLLEPGSSEAAAESPDQEPGETGDEASPAADTLQEQPQQVEVEVPPAEEVPAAAVAAAAPETSEDGQTVPVLTQETAADSETQPVAAANPEDQSESPEPITAVGRPNVPDRPKIVKPAGVQLVKPQEAVLRGPKVVRIEQPDVVEAPPRRRPAGGGDVSGPGGGGEGVRSDRGPGWRGRPGGGVDSGDGDGPGGGRSAAGSGKRRSLSSRRGRSAEALVSGPSKFSEQDLIELDARLNRATGFLKIRRRNLSKSGTAIPAAPTPAAVGGKVEIAEPISIKALSAATGIKTTDIIKYLFKKGVMATINSSIGVEAAMEIALEYNIELVVREQQTAEQKVIEEFEARPVIDERPRPPVVTVLGHVDHGKTSLLDKIRSADVASREAGGITQHVGAYRVSLKGNDDKLKTVVFLDTPGHEAFTSMRARGAQITDLVVLVVAADDGVMPQTVESINHAKAAGVPIIVALNKIDKPESTPERIRKIYGQLAEQGLNPVEWGGQTEVMKVSAATGQGVSDLIEVLDYQAELLELKADYGGPARGTVIETQMHPGRGPVARMLVEQGQLNVGDFIVIGRAYGRVRDMTDDHGRPLTTAGPATPLELSGIDLVPDAGDKFYITDSLQKAEQVATQYREKERNTQLANKTKVTLDNFADQLAEARQRELRVVLKADVQGSIDVLRGALGELGSDEVSIKLLHSGVGGITESDVLLADASNAVIIGFHVAASPRARELAEQRSVEIRMYRVIYELTDELTKALEGMLKPETKENILGSAEVRQVFKISKLGPVAGCLVVEGTAQRQAMVRVVRDGVVVTEGRSVESLRRVKDDVKEVRSGTECGVKIAGFDDLKPGDTLVFYQTITVARKLT